MKRFWFAAIGTVGIALSVGTSSSNAQPPVPGGIGYSRSPAFSPYLNLLRGGTSPTLNYFGLVRPQMEARQAIIGLEGDVSMNQQALTNLEATGGALGSTGHLIRFMNLGGYFMNTSGTLQGAGGGSGGGSNSVGSGWCCVVCGSRVCIPCC